MLGETTRYLIENNSDVDVTLRRQLIAGRRAIQVDAAQTLAVDILQVPARLNCYFHCLFSCCHHIIIITS